MLITTSRPAQVLEGMKVQKSFPECTPERIRSVLAPMAHGVAKAAQDVAGNPSPAKQDLPQAAESAAQGPREDSGQSQEGISKTSANSAVQGPGFAPAAEGAQAAQKGHEHFAPLTGRDAVSGTARMMPGGKKGYFW